jgi:DNA-binding transcriptional MocR family regulator
MIVAPDHLVDAVSHAVRAGAWTAPNVSLAISVQLIETGILEEIAADKRLHAQNNWQIAKRAFDQIPFKSDPRAFHGWLPLPPGCRLEAFVELVLQKGISVAPGTAFAALPGHAPQGVRLALSHRDPEILYSALNSIQNILLDSVSDKTSDEC